MVPAAVERGCPVHRRRKRSGLDTSARVDGEYGSITVGKEKSLDDRVVAAQLINRRVWIKPARLPGVEPHGIEVRQEQPCFGATANEAGAVHPPQVRQRLWRPDRRSVRNGP